MTKILLLKGTDTISVSVKINKSHSTEDLIHELRIFNHHESADRLQKLQFAIQQLQDENYALKCRSWLSLLIERIRSLF